MREGEHALPCFEELETSPEVYFLSLFTFQFSIDWVLTRAAKTRFADGRTPMHLSTHRCIVYSTCALNFFILG